MISAISTSQASSLSSVSSRAAKIAALTKQVGSLQQELSSAQKSKPVELAGLKSNSISQNIATVQSQIEKVVLEAQLSKLSLRADTTTADTTSSSPSSSPKTDESSDSAAKKASDAEATGDAAQQDAQATTESADAPNGLDVNGKKVQKDHAKDPKEVKDPKDVKDAQVGDAKETYDRIFHQGHRTGDGVPVVYQLTPSQPSTIKLQA